MIRNDQEYQATLKRVEQDRQVAAQQQAALEQAGLAPGEVERAMQPLLSFHAQLAEEVTWYERVKRRDFGVLSQLSGLGRLLIALRIANNLTQRELAQRLGVDESQVSRDERNEYYGITVERAQRVLDALGAEVVTRVVEAGDQRARVSA
jgi:DNA-directed RNA polymerase specialized sigma subunit